MKYSLVVLLVLLGISCVIPAEHVDASYGYVYTEPGLIVEPEIVFGFRGNGPINRHNYRRDYPHHYNRK